MKSMWLHPWKEWTTNDEDIHKNNFHVCKNISTLLSVLIFLVILSELFFYTLKLWSNEYN